MRDLPPGAANSRDWFRPEGFTALRVLTAKILQPKSLQPLPRDTIYLRDALDLHACRQHFTAISSIWETLNQRRENFGG